MMEEEEERSRATEASRNLQCRDPLSLLVWGTGSSRID